MPARIIDTMPRLLQAMREMVDKPSREQAQRVGQAFQQECFEHQLCHKCQIGEICDVFYPAHFNTNALTIDVPLLHLACVQFLANLEESG